MFNHSTATLGHLGTNHGSPSNVISLGGRPTSENPAGRVRRGSETVGLCLVDTNDSRASAYRFYDGSNVKAIAKVVNVS